MHFPWGVHIVFRYYSESLVFFEFSIDLFVPVVHIKGLNLEFLQVLRFRIEALNKYIPEDAKNYF